MNKLLQHLSIFICCLISLSGYAQKNVTTFGLQFKPIISSEIINTGPQFTQVGDIGFKVSPDGGYSFGMVIRKGITNQLSFETGINYTKRNHRLLITEDSTGFSGESDFSYVIYEIPLLALVYVQLGQQTFLNTAFGASINFLPSDWDSFDSYFQHYSRRQSWVVPSLLANVGFEYRTYEKGFIYLGFSYHRPFSRLTNAGFLYQSVNENNVFVERERAFFDISGNYLTLDLRYFFHEDPDRKKRKRRK